MTEFQLDTSGEIVLPYPNLHPHARGIRWPDLSPFAQGYVTAMLNQPIYVYDLDGSNDGEIRVRLGFRHLAPAILAVMLKDCEAALRPGLARTDTKDSGANFWAIRQLGFYADSKQRQFWPPLHLSLAPDGLIHAEVKS